MPLKIDSEHKAVIAYLRNYELIGYIVDKLRPCDFSSYKNAISHDKIAEVIAKMYPTDYDLENEDASDIIIYKYNKKIINIFKDISRKLFLVNNGKVYLKNDNLSDYNLYTTSLDVYPFFAQYLIDKSNDLEFKDSENQINYLIAYTDETFRFYGNIENKLDEITDAHMHLGAALDFHYRLHDILSYPHEQIYEFPQELYVYLYNIVTSSEFYTLFSLLETIIIERIIGYDENSSTQSPLNELLDLIKKMNNKSSFVFDDKEKLDWLKIRCPSIRINQNRFYGYDFTSDIDKKIFIKILNYFNSSSEDYNVKYGDKLLIIFFMRTLNNLTSQSDENISSDDETTINLLWLYFIFRNITKLTLVQQHRKQGFGYFASYAGNPFYKSGKQCNKTYRRLKSLFHSRLNTNIEGRTTIECNENDTIDASAYKTKQSIIKYIKSLEKIKNETNLNHRLKLMYHFVKAQDENEKKLIDIQEFTKYESINESILHTITKPKYGSLRDRYRQEAMTINQIFVRPEYRFAKYAEIHEDDECSNDIKNNDTKHILIDLFEKYIGGIDAANKEHYTPPEVFSAVYAFFKNSITSSGLVLEQKDGYQIDPVLLNEVNLQYSFHAGEEFRDIVSGLRAIYEAVIFLNLKDEDRIGHAVALGIDPALFLGSRKIITLSKGEYLDNLLFMYFLFGQRNGAPVSLERLKNKIHRLASRIYNYSFQDRGYSVDDFIDAWLLRRNCPNELDRLYRLLNEINWKNLIKSEEILKRLERYVEQSDYKEEDTQNINAKSNEQSKVLFVKEITREVPNVLNMLELKKYENIFLENALPDFFNKVDYTLEPLKRFMKAQNNPNAFKIYEQYCFDPLVTYRAKQVYRENPLFEYDVYEYLQDLIMEDVIVKKDVVVEILPTSNILITSIDSYEKHHFIRLNPPKEIVRNKFGIREGKVKLVIGTDDPGIQGTNLMMEVYHIHNIVAKKFDKRIADEYVLDILKFGNYIFNKK
jgi:hypothetical protein